LLYALDYLTIPTMNTRSLSRSRRLAPSFLVASIATLLAGPARADEFQWDLDLSTPGAQGSGGSWFGGNYWLNGGINYAWSAVPFGSDVFFGGFGGTITTNSDISLGNIRFGANYTLTSTGNRTLTLGGGTIEVAPAVNATVNMVLTGSNGLTKNGAGTLSFTKSPTYTGDTWVKAGTLSVFNGAGLPDTTNVIVSSGAQLTVLGNDTIGSLAGDGTVQINFSIGTGTLTAGGSNASTIFAGTITGDGSFAKSGSGSLTLSGLNTFTGGFSVFGSGSVSVESLANKGVPSPIGAGSSMVINGTLAVTKPGNFSTDRDIVLNGGTLSLPDAGTTVTFTKEFYPFSSGSLHKAGAGTLVLPSSSGGNGSKSIFVDAGTVVAGANSLSSVFTITVNQGATLKLLSNQNMGGLHGAGVVDLGANALEFNGGNFSGLIIGTGSLRVGAGFLTGLSTFSGGAQILSSVSINRLGNAGENSPLGLGALTLGTASSPGRIYYDGPNNDQSNRSITLAPGGGEIVVVRNVLTLDGLITGTGMLTHISGALVLTNPANSWTGGVSAAGGTLSFSTLADAGTPSPLGAGSSIGLQSGAPFALQGSINLPTVP
jgi:fibronectin-binding autotransporter adhesin